MADTNSLLDAAVSKHEAGQLAEAQAICAEILKQDARHPDALNLMGVLAAQSGQMTEALELIRAAIVEQPENHHFRFNHAHVLELAGEGSAVKAYREALTINPQHLPALINLGNLLLEQDNLGEAIDCFNRAISANRDISVAHLGLGIALQRKQQPEDALRCFEQALRLDPNSLEAISNVASLMVDLGRTAEALPYLRRALAGAPGSAELNTNLGVALFENKDLEGAVAALEAARALDQNNCRATAMLALLMAARGDEESLRALFDYEGLLRLRRLTQVPGFSDLAHFNRSLVERVLNHPTLMADRPSKTTRVGAQTGDLSEDPDEAIQTLVSTIRSEIEAYFAALAGRPGAPAAPPQGWRLTLWATVLRQGGYQDPHVHPSGRISGVYYARIPAPREASDPEQGAITFGVGPARFGEIAMPRHALRPSEGTLLLFPSYFWHRTVPFEAEPERISLAFDAVPLSQ